MVTNCDRALKALLKHVRFHALPNSLGNALYRIEFEF